MYGKIIFYSIGIGAFGITLLQLCQPSAAEIQQIKAYANNINYSTFAVVKSASESSEPLYRQSSAQIQRKAHEAIRRMEADGSESKTK